MFYRLVAVAVSGLLAATLPAGAAAAQSISGQDLTPEGRAAYVALAGAANAFEVRAGEMALEKSRRPEVRELAEEMIDQHREAIEELLAAAESLGMETYEPGMMPFHWEWLRRLERASDSRFDRVYLDQRTEAHEMILEMHRNFAENGSEASLRTIAQEEASIAYRHLEQARALQ